jgi:virginiamycin B lyase
MATPACFTHRVLASPHGWYVTELGACQIAHVSAGWAGAGLRVIDEAADYYSDFGMGVPGAAADYGAPFGRS